MTDDQLLTWIKRRKEKAEQYDRNPNWIDQQLAKLATSIGRVDRIKD